MSKVCAIDTETGGLVAGQHELIAIAVVPLNAAFEQDGEPFYTKVRPEYPDRLTPGALKVNGESEESLASAPSRQEAIQAFLEWTNRTIVAPGHKCIAPLAHNWAFDGPFIENWLDPTHESGVMSTLFETFGVRDTKSVCMWLKDRAAALGRPAAFRYCSLKEMQKTLNIEVTWADAAHTAIGDALMTAACYRGLLRLGS
jgi:DNA polymerase III epsilon subunit-like protein